MGREVKAALLAVVMWGATACGRPPPEAEARLAEVQAEADALDAALDGVEDRLLGGRMRVQLWSELASRHSSVTEVTCRTNAQHLESLVRHFEKTEQTLRKKRGRRVATPARAMLEPGVGGP